MKDLKLTGSFIGAVHHDDYNRLARVHFKNGDMWHYAGVPQNVMDEWQIAESPGKFFQTEIKPNYEGTKVN